MTRPIRSSHDIKGVSLDVSAPIRIDTPGPLQVEYLAGRGSRLVVSFAGVGQTRGTTPPREFTGSASAEGENHVMFISDASRSWMNGHGIAQSVLRHVEQFCDFHGITEVVAMGNSMGGFAAIVLAELMPVKTVIAFSAQFSAHQDQVPEETRWKFFRSKIEHWDRLTVGDMAQADTTYIIVHADAPEEAVHWRRFPQNPQVNHFIVTGQDHNVVRVMQKRRILPGVISAAIAGKTRMVRKQMQRSVFGREFAVMRREDYEQELTEARPDADAQAGTHP